LFPKAPLLRVEALDEGSLPCLLEALEFLSPPTATLDDPTAFFSSGFADLCDPPTAAFLRPED
jgi:hypothetical protein